METFIVTYHSGEYDSYNDHVYSITAESKEAILDEIFKAIDFYVDNQLKWRNDSLKHTYLGSLPVFGNALAIFDDILIKSDKNKIVKSANLQIMTIEEYIESIRPEKV